MVRSPNQLQQEARTYKYNKSISLKIYLKTCISLIEKAQTLNNDFENSYLYYMRYLDLCMNKLPSHPEIIVAQKQQRNQYSLEVKEYYQNIKLEVPAVLKIVEDLQKPLELIYQKELAKQYIKPSKKPTHIPSLVTNETHPVSSCEKDYKLEIELPSTFNENMFHQSVDYLAKKNSDISMIKVKRQTLPSMNQHTETSRQGARVESKYQQTMLSYHLPDLSKPMTFTNKSTSSKLYVGQMFDKRSIPDEKEEELKISYPDLPNLCI